MLKRKNQKVINVSGIENDDLIKMIENMEGVNVRKTVNGVQITIHKQTLDNACVGVRVRKKNKKGRKMKYLTPIYGSNKRSVDDSPKSDSSQFRQSSAIIAKTF